MINPIRITWNALLESIWKFCKRIFSQKKLGDKPSIVVVPKPKLDLKIDVSKSRRWAGIVWHHSLSADTQTRNWGGIVKYHTKDLGYRDVAYNGGTEWMDGKVVFHWGRPLSMIGAHAGVKNVSNKFNEEYLGFCAIGDFDNKPPKLEHWDFNLKLTRSFMEAFKIPAEQVIGHREVFKKLGVTPYKTCPGLKWDTSKFRSQL